MIEILNIQSLIIQQHNLFEGKNKKNPRKILSNPKNGFIIITKDLKKEQFKSILWELILTLEECISSIDCGIFSFVNDAEFTIKISNQYFLDLFFPEEIEGKTLKSVLLPTHFYELQDIIRQKIAEKQRTFIYSMIILGRGFYTWQECRFSIKDYSDTEKLISCVCFDVTQSKNKSLSLKYENEILNIALQKSFIDKNKSRLLED